MASVASQLIEEVTAHAQSDSLEDVREICADGTYFPNNLRITISEASYIFRPPVVTIRKMFFEVILHRVLSNITSNNTSLKMARTGSRNLYQAS